MLFREKGELFGKELDKFQNSGYYLAGFSTVLQEMYKFPKSDPTFTMVIKVTL